VTPSEFPTWRPLTYESGYVTHARFGPDGQSIVYSASWDDKPIRLYTRTTLSLESRPLDLPAAGLLAVSRSGVLAVSLSCGYSPTYTGCLGTLGRAPLLGGAPRGLEENVRFADWGPDGTLAAIVGGRVEYPLGTPITEGTQVRISPDGRSVAWTEQRGTERPNMALVVRDERSTRVLSEGWEFTTGLAWTSDGTALLLSGFGKASNNDTVLRIGLDGSKRPILRSASRIRVLDADNAGRLLVDQDRLSTRVWLTSPTPGTERRDITWLGESVADALSADGRTVLLTIRGPAREEADRYPIYIRPTDGAAAAFLGSGYGLDLSRDGRWALTLRQGSREFIVHPLGPGSARTLDRGGLALENELVASFAGGSRVVFAAQEGKGPLRTYVQSIDGGPPALVAHEPGRVVSAVAPDGERFISQRSDGSLWLATITSAPAVPPDILVAAGSDRPALERRRAVCLRPDTHPGARHPDEDQRAIRPKHATHRNQSPGDQLRWVHARERRWPHRRLHRKHAPVAIVSG
jgi:eukaryotic-like serine/threonine-protein kinase